MCRSRHVPIRGLARTSLQPGVEAYTISLLVEAYDSQQALVGSSSATATFSVRALPPQIVLSRPGSQFLVPNGLPFNIDGARAPTPRAAARVACRGANACNPMCHGGAASASGSFNPNPGATATDRTCSWTCEFTAFEASPEPCAGVPEFAGVDLCVRANATRGRRAAGADVGGRGQARSAPHSASCNLTLTADTTKSNATISLVLSVTASSLTSTRSVRPGTRRVWRARSNGAHGQIAFPSRSLCCTAQVVVRVGDDVKAQVFVALQSALNTNNLPVVSRSRPVRLLSFVRFVNSSAREADATFTYQWSAVNTVRSGGRSAWYAPHR